MSNLIFADVGFLFPLFLLAGLSLLIPLLIHLFNLRRYKRVLFPHTRFLRNIELQSRRQNKLRYKWLLALRLLFLAALVLAFAQPFLKQSQQSADTGRLQVIYIDNSYSMSVQQGPRTLLDMAREAARRRILSTNGRVLLLTNGRPDTYAPVTPEQALARLGSIDISPESKTSEQVLASVQSIMQSEGVTTADLYYYSDFQRGSFRPAPEQLMRGISFTGIPIQAAEAANIFIDTAFLASPVLQPGQNNRLMVRSRALGPAPKTDPVLQLFVDGQLRSASSLDFSSGRGERTDTLSFSVSGAGWQRISLSLNDASLRFDDTFRISARSAPNLSVLALYEQQPNPYIQAAFRSYEGFRLRQAQLGQAPQDWSAYNLVILDGITSLTGSLAQQLGASLERGRSVCIFPGRTAQPAALNEGLRQLADVRLSGLVSEPQPASSLQQGSELVRDLFEHIPENVQLPVANWHYTISSGLSANQQTVLAFRNGDPFLARYSAGRGHLYLCATAASLEAGNFPASYFFVPFLYQMAYQTGGGDVYALSSGSRQPAYLPGSQADERRMMHLYGPGLDVIPPQRPSGPGLQVFIDQVAPAPGFYSLAAQDGDTTVVALNAGRAESELATWSPAELKNTWHAAGVRWLDASAEAKQQAGAPAGALPLWKVCIILALLLLLAETFVLAGNTRKKEVAVQ